MLKRSDKSDASNFKAGLFLEAHAPNRVQSVTRNRTPASNLAEPFTLFFEHVLNKRFIIRVHILKQQTLFMISINHFFEQTYSKRLYSFYLKNTFL